MSLYDCFCHLYLLLVAFASHCSRYDDCGLELHLAVAQILFLPLPPQTEGIVLLIKRELFNFDLVFSVWVVFPSEPPDTVGSLLVMLSVFIFFLKITTNAFIHRVRRGILTLARFKMLIKPSYSAL